MSHGSTFAMTAVFALGALACADLMDDEDVSVKDRAFLMWVVAVLSLACFLGRLTVPGHRLTGWAGAYEAAAHIWVGALIVLWLSPRRLDRLCQENLWEMVEDYPWLGVQLRGTLDADRDRARRLCRFALAALSVLSVYELVMFLCR